MSEWVSKSARIELFLVYYCCCCYFYWSSQFNNQTNFYNFENFIRFWNFNQKKFFLKLFFFIVWKLIWGRIPNYKVKFIHKIYDMFFLFVIVCVWMFKINILFELQYRKKKQLFCLNWNMNDTCIVSIFGLTRLLCLYRYISKEIDLFCCYVVLIWNHKK